MKKGVIIITGLFLLAMAVFFFQALDMATFNRQGVPGPGFTPKLYLGIGLLTSIIIIFNAIKLKDIQAKISTNSLVVKIMLLSVLYIILISILGYWLSTLAAFVAMYKILSVKGWKTILALSAGFIIAVYLVFFIFLKVPIPSGILF